ncbi:MAG TPA: dihydroorotase [Thermoanaerobaculia bacterium]|nr:dihydroorotase [Thermoanaerobaculia bacterium]
MSGVNLLIQGGRLIDPSQEMDETVDLLIEDGRVSKSAKGVKAPAGVETFDASGLVVAPGLVDLHTHLREPGQEHKETIRTGTRAAVAGGYTSVCAMANTAPPNDERAVTEMILAEAARNGACRVYAIGAVSKGLAGEALAELADLRAAGCVAFSDDGKPVSNALLMRRALEYSKMLGVPIVAHEQDLDLSDGGVMHEGFVSTVLGMRGIPAVSEEVMTARDVMLTAMTGAHLHVAHISTAGALESVRRGRQDGVRITCEVAPHHIALADEEVRSFSTQLKMNPPLRSEEHRRALIEGIADGTIDAIATDHAPHHPDEKNVEFDLAPFGVIGLETAFAVCHEVLVAKGKKVGLARLIDLMSCAPARIFGLPGGTLRKGSPGDVVLLDPAGETVVALPFQSRAQNSPFLGRTLRGKVAATFVGGELRWRAAGSAGSSAGPKRKRKAGEKRGR